MANQNRNYSSNRISQCVKKEDKLDTYQKSKNNYSTPLQLKSDIQGQSKNIIFKEYFFIDLRDSNTIVLTYVKNKIGREPIYWGKMTNGREQDTNPHTYRSVIF